jgi:NAD(P)-dependent dehydrogenase (short-subunit alcohol dehydrogenase family)
MLIIVTGVSGGIGGYVFDDLARDFNIVGTYHTRTPQLGESRELYRVDVTSASAIGEFVESISSKLDRVVLVNMAGVSLDAMGHKMTEETWDRVVDTNLKGVFLMCRALLPVMRKQRWGRIINISSVVGQMGVPGTAAYSASKAGLGGLTRSLAAENVTNGVTVNSLALGYFGVGLIDTIPPDIQEQIREKIPMKRFGDARNVALAIRFLVEADYVTGATININGGLVG